MKAFAVAVMCVLLAACGSSGGSAKNEWNDTAEFSWMVTCRSGKNKLPEDMCLCLYDWARHNYSTPKGWYADTSSGSDRDALRACM